MTVKQFDNLVNKIMAEAKADGEPVTLEEAREMARMEMKANEENRRYEQTSVTRKRKNKKDPEKVAIIAGVCEYLKSKGYDAVITNDVKQIDFGVFTLSLVKHRPKKEH